MLSPAAAGTREDRGSAALGVLVLMIVTLLALTAVTSGIRGIGTSRRDSASAQAASAAELGLADAAAKIVGGATVNFAGTGTRGGADYEYSAAATGADTWLVRVEATVGGVGRAFEAGIQRQAEHPFTVFVAAAARITNNAGVVTGRFGTNGSLAIAGPAPGTSQELYRPAATCTGCTNPVDRDGPFALPDATATPSGPVQRCPVAGEFTGTVDGGRGVPYLCDDPGTPLVFTGAVVVRNGPLVVHVGDGVDVSLAGANLNGGGPAADVRITAAGAGRLDLDAARVHGVVFAPGRGLVVRNVSVVGALVIGDLDVPRGGRLDASPDRSVTAVGSGSWTVGALRSVPIA